MTRFFPWLLLSLALPSLAAEPDARALVQRWITVGSGVKSIELDFVQERKLKALRQPLSKAGHLWFQRPEAFRWQIGEPPTLIATRGTNGFLQVADTQKKKLRTWTAAELAAEAGNGRGNGFGMAGAALPSTIEAFEQVFQIRSAKETETPGVWIIRLDLQDKKAGLFVKEILFTLQPETGSLRQFEIHMRDGSIMTTRVTREQKNKPIPSSMFNLDTGGYEIETAADR